MRGNHKIIDTKDLSVKLRYRCADCNWTSRRASRASLQSDLEEHTRKTGHQKFFTDSSHQD